MSIVSTFKHTSLSARRAWIEIDVNSASGTLSDTVALRKESVDRNNFGRLHNYISVVALRKESVDRNCRAGTDSPNRPGRSPQGERG